MVRELATVGSPIYAPKEVLFFTIFIFIKWSLMGNLCCKILTMETILKVVAPVTDGNPAPTN